MVTASGLHVARTTALLNFKISSSYKRSTEIKKFTDWLDVAYLIDWHVSNNIPLPSGTIPNATYDAFCDCHIWHPEITDVEWVFIGGSLKNNSVGFDQSSRFEELFDTSTIPPSDPVRVIFLHSPHFNDRKFPPATKKCRIFFETCGCVKLVGMP